MLWARIDNKRVVELTDIDPEGRFVPELIWVKCPKDVCQGMAYVDGMFTQYSEPVKTLTVEEVERARLIVYADPVTGCDRYFAEAARLQVMGGSAVEIEAVRNAGAARYAEIQALYHWPE